MQLIEIGIIHSPYDRDGKNKAPRQGMPYDGTVSTIELREDFIGGLRGLDQVSYIDVLYWADQADRSILVSGHKGDEPRGVFSLRSPVRPNPINIATCRILSIDKNIIKVSGLDALDQSLLIDIKPYVDRFSQEKKI